MLTASPEPQTPTGHTLPLPPVAASQAVLLGEPDLRATRGLCFGSAVTCAGFGVWLLLAVFAAADRMAPRDAMLVSLLAVLLALLMLGLAFFLLRSGLTVGACFRIDAQGFSYGNDRPGTVIQRCDWKDLRRNPESPVDIGLSLQPRYGVLNPDLTFWQRDSQGQLTQRYLSLSLRDNGLQCLRFRNAHALRVALLQGMARQGLRFDGEVFVEARVDPQTWQCMRGPRRGRWLLALGSIGLLLLAVQSGWPLPAIILCTLLALGLGYAATMALARSEPYLSGVIDFSPVPRDERTSQ